MQKKKRLTETSVCTGRAEIFFQGCHSLVNVPEFLRCGGFYFAVAVRHSQLHVGETLHPTGLSTTDHV